MNQMDAIRRLGHVGLRIRYLLLLAWAYGWFAIAYETRPKGVLTDWLWFEFGARTLIHLNSHYASGALGLYAHNPEIQIGPPPLAIVACFQWLSPHTVRLLLTIAMAAAGIWCVRCVELTAIHRKTFERARSLQTTILLAGLVVVPIWAWESARWGHLDDVMAITGAMTAMAMIAGGKRWWLVALVLGVAVASKPWALIITPCLLGLPREDRAKATLLTILTAGACWGPFIVGDPQTIHALGSFQFPVDAGSTMHFLGMPIGTAPNWVRPVQFLGGLLVSILAVRRGRWMAVPLIGFGFRVFMDPQMWLYYGLGPIIGAALWDCSSRRKLPLWTGITALVEFGVPTVSPPWSGPTRLVWFAVLAVAILRPSRDVVAATTDPASTPAPAVTALTVATSSSA